MPFCSCLPAGLPQPFTNIICMKSWDWVWEDLGWHGLRREAQELSDGNQLLFILGFSNCSVGEGCCETSGCIHSWGKLRQVLSGEIRLTPLAGLKIPPWWCLVLVLNYWKGHWGTRRPLIFVEERALSSHPGDPLGPFLPLQKAWQQSGWALSPEVALRGLLRSSGWLSGASWVGDRQRCLCSAQGTAGSACAPAHWSTPCLVASHLLNEQIDLVFHQRNASEGK